MDFTPSADALDLGTNGDTLERRTATLVGHIVKSLHEVRLLQHEYDDGSASDDPRKAMLADAATYIRLALGTKDSMGLLDLLGIQTTEDWIEGAVIDGYYCFDAEDTKQVVPIYRYDTSTGSIYSAADLRDKEITFWHKSPENAISHICSSFGYPPNGNYEFLKADVPIFAQV